MNILTIYLTIYAHPNPKSFCHAVHQQFTKVLADADHSNEVVDLYAIGFDSVWRALDSPNWMDENLPQDVLDRANLKQELLVGAKGPWQRFLVKRWIGDKDARAIIRSLREKRRPRDVLEQQRKVARAQALVFNSPVLFVGFSAILNGWFDRVFTLGIAAGLSELIGIKLPLFAICLVVIGASMLLKPLYSKQRHQGGDTSQ